MSEFDSEKSKWTENNEWRSCIDVLPDSGEMVVVKRKVKFFGERTFFAKRGSSEGCIWLAGGGLTPVLITDQWKWIRIEENK